MNSADENPVHADFRPQPVCVITGVEALRALGDPTRMKLIEVMVQRQDPPWSVKELAAALGVPTTRLYHHVEQLVANDLVRAVEQRVVSGIIETRYRAVALSYQIDRHLFSGGTDAARSAASEAVATVFDTTRDELEAAIRSGAADAGEAEGERRVTLGRSLVRLTPSRREELHRRLRELIEEFDGEETADGTPVGLMVAAYPVDALAGEPAGG